MIRFVLHNLEDSDAKSWIVGLCAALVAGFAVAATLVLGGAEQSLNLALQRLGADIIVVPAGVESKVENALLMGAPVRAWMPEANVAAVRDIPGVAVASPQVYLATLRGATCCTLPEMFLIAYEPETDFTLRPWLEQNQRPQGLALGEVVGGSFVYVPEGDDRIKIYGFDVDLVGNLAQTGSGLDATMFLPLPTAREVSRRSYTDADQPLLIERDSVSSILVRLASGADSAAVADQIRRVAPGVTPIASASLFGTQREQLGTLIKSIAVLLAIVWALSIALVGVVFTLAINERRREMGVLRALGATRGRVTQALFLEVAILAMAGGLLGAGLAAFAVYLFRNLLIRLMRTPFLYPEPTALLGLIAAALGVTLLSVGIAVIWPALRVSYQEPAVSMRE